MSISEDNLTGITAFVAVVQKGSFTAAAEVLGCSTSKVSKELSRLEQRLGVGLLNRTTRQFRLTDLGQAYYEKAQQIVADADRAAAEITSQLDRPHGVLRVSAPFNFGHNYLTSKLPDFVEAFPELQLDVIFDERIVDIIAEGFDLAIRVGHLPDSNLVHRKLKNSGSVTVVSPTYIKKYGEPKHPHDLAEHRVVSFSNKQAPGSWEYTTADNEFIRVSVTSILMTNDAELELSMARTGAAVARLPRHCCEADLKSGELVQILAPFEPDDFGVYAVFPKQTSLPIKVRVFVDFLVECFR